MVPVTLFIWLLIEIASYMALSRYWFNASWDVAVLGALSLIHISEPTRPY